MKSQTIPNFIIVDDDTFNNFICQKIILSVFPQTDIKTFTDPEKALIYLESTYSLPNSANTVLFLDINMSNISGWEFLKVFEQFDISVKKFLKVYMLSSSINPRDKVLATSNKNVWNYISKPLTKQVVKDTVTKVREEEMTSVSREIQDKLGQQLMRIKMDIIWLSSKIKYPSDEIKEKITASIALIDETVETTRRIDAELRPRILDDLGLFAALEWQVAEFTNHTGIPCELIVNFSGEPEFSKFLSGHIFRIFQEALNNVARHAQAKEVNTKLNYLNGNMILSIEDNGRGFNTKTTKNIKSLGLLRMKEYACMINGAIKIRSNPGEGTKIELIVPVII